MSSRKKNEKYCYPHNSLFEFVRIPSINKVITVLDHEIKIKGEI